MVRVVEICYNNAKKYNLDFSNVTGNEGKEEPAANGSKPIADDSQQFGSRSRPQSNTNRDAGNKRTRVSFLLY